MGKKRKASSQAYNHTEQSSKKPESSKLIINTYEDVADSEDEFLSNRDRVLLDEGSDAKRRRKIQENGTRC
jgi:U3 small nucleolar RNA-associated protein 3